MHALLNSTTGRYLIGGTLAFVAAIGLTWHFRADPETESTGRIQIVGEKLSLSSPNSGPASQEKMAPIPIRPTETNALKVRDQVSALLQEPRDTAWAPRSEAAIREFTQTIPYIGGGNRVLKIACKASSCEMNGFAGPDPATGTMGPVWEALERDTAGSELRAHGLERTAAIFDTGRSGDEFKIYYRRTGPPDVP